MRVAFDLSPTATVIVAEEGEKYHRQASLPWKVAACWTTVSSGTRLLSRADAEVCEYEPCTKYGCFAEHTEE